MSFANSQEIIQGAICLKKEETKIYQGNYKASIGNYYLFL
jgi:hypothetical protein